MKKLLLLSFLFIGFNSFAQEKFQLAPPMLKFKSAFFASNTSFEVQFNQPGAEIRYTLNGNEPTEKDLLYTGPVTVTKRTIVKIKAIGSDFLPSETVRAEFIKDGKAVQEITVSTPNEFYAKAKKDILYDNVGGFSNYRVGTWIGYNSDSAVVNITFGKQEKISSVLVSILVDEDSWIFTPEQIELLYLESTVKRVFLINKMIFDHDTPIPKRCFVFELEPAVSITTSQLTLVFSVLKKIPDWHPGKGNHAWLFIDEIKVY